MKRKILLIKLEAPVYSSIGMESAFSEYFEVHTINWQHINFTQGYEALWPHIVTTCLEVMPDIIFCQFQKPVLSTEQFKRLAKYGYVINYTEDVRENIHWYIEAAPHIGLTIFTNMDDCEKMWNLEIKNVAYMMVSYNHIWYKPQPKTEKNYGEIVFLGTNYVGSNLNFPLAQERQDIIAFMKEKFGDIFQAYGLGQENQHLNPPQAVEAYNNAKVAITHSNFKRRGYMSDRGMNAMGCGCLTVHQYFEGIEEMFKLFPLVPTWKTFDELEEKCNYYLQENRKLDYLFDYKNTMPEYMKENHSWIERAPKIKELIKKHSICLKKFGLM